MDLKVLFVDVSGVDAEHHQHLTSALDCLAVDNLAVSLLGNHVEQGGAQVLADAAESDDFVPEEDQAEVVDVLTVVLLHVHPIHVHENVSDHDHGGLVVVPDRVEGLQEVVVDRGHDVDAHFVLQMGGHNLSEAGVQPLAVLVEDHGVGVAVELLEAEARVVFPLNFLNGVLQEVPDVLHVLFVHGHGEGPDSHLALLLGAAAVGAAGRGLHDFSLKTKNRRSNKC